MIYIDDPWKSTNRVMYKHLGFPKMTTGVFIATTFRPKNRIWLNRFSRAKRKRLNSIFSWLDFLDGKYKYD